MSPANSSECRPLRKRTRPATRCKDRGTWGSKAVGSPPKTLLNSKIKGLHRHNRKPSRNWTSYRWTSHCWQCWHPSDLVPDAKVGCTAYTTKYRAVAMAVRNPWSWAELRDQICFQNKGYWATGNDKSTLGWTGVSMAKWKANRMQGKIIPFKFVIRTSRCTRKGIQLVNWSWKNVVHNRFPFRSSLIFPPRSSSPKKALILSSDRNQWTSMNQSISCHQTSPFFKTAYCCTGKYICCALNLRQKSNKKKKSLSSLRLLFFGEWVASRFNWTRTVTERPSSWDKSDAWSVDRMSLPSLLQTPQTKTIWANEKGGS